MKKTIVVMMLLLGSLGLVTRAEAQSTAWRPPTVTASLRGYLKELLRRQVRDFAVWRRAHVRWPRPINDRAEHGDLARPRPRRPAQG